MNTVIFGPPGAGKGTQADNLVKNYNLFKVSAGDLLRKEINKKTKLGNEINSTISQGTFVKDEVIDNLIENIISNSSNKNRMIFDGYPRNLNQAKKLDLLLNNHNQKISLVISLNADKKTLVKRILGRLVCLKCGSTFNKFFNPPIKSNHKCESRHLEVRSDDNEETILKRFDVYEKETMPILNYYKKQKLLTNIDGMNKIDEIYKEIRQIMTSLKT